MSDLVQTFKQFLRRKKEVPLSKNYHSYRNIPNSIIGQTPAELMLKRRPRTRLDFLRTDLDNKASNRQADQKLKHDQHSKDVSFLMVSPCSYRTFEANRNG